MCKFKSAIILKDRVFIPDYDSHSDMLWELKIEDTRENAERLFVRAELVPNNGDYTSDIATWEYIVDQDILPDWYVPSYDEQRMRDAVSEWAKERIHVGIDGLKIDSGAGHIIKDCKNILIYGDAQVRRICGNAQVTDIYDNAQVRRIYGNAQVTNICGNAQVTNIYGNAQVTNIYGNAQVMCIYGNAQVTNIYGNAQVTVYFNWKGKSDVVIKDNALLIDCEDVEETK